MIKVMLVRGKDGGRGEEREVRASLSVAHSEVGHMVSC